MLKNSLKNVESDNNKVLYETLLDFFRAKQYLLSEIASYLRALKCVFPGSYNINNNNNNKQANSVCLVSWDFLLTKKGIDFGLLRKWSVAE